MSWLALLACAVHDPPRPDAAHSPGQPLSLNIHHLAAHFFVKVSTAHFPRNTTVVREKPRKSWNGAELQREAAPFCFIAHLRSIHGREWRLGFTTMTLVSFEVAAPTAGSCKLQK